MMQPVAKKKPVVKAEAKKNPKAKDNRLPPKTKGQRRWRRPQHKEYGTSKLEERFASDFLDRLGVEYQYQFKAEDIGRYYDFWITPDGPIIEVNGGYWHSDPRLYEEEDLNRIQKRARRIDEYKEKWALAHGIPIYYFWEKDINERPQWVLEQLKEILNLDADRRRKKDNKKKRH